MLLARMIAALLTSNFPSPLAVCHLYGQKPSIIDACVSKRTYLLIIRNFLFSWPALSVCSPRDAHIIGVLIFLLFLFLFLFHWKLETTDFGHFCCFQILDDVITAECITSRGYAARFHLGCDIIVISPVCYRDGWVRVGGGGQEKKDHD